MIAIGHLPRRILGLMVDVVLVVMVVVVALLLVLPLTGRHLIVITGGSMEPTIPLGGLVLAERPADPAAIAVGDIVTIRLPQGTVYTHRVARIEDTSGVRLLVTKGDNNDSADAAPVPVDEVIGVARLWVPLGGYVVTFLQTTQGRIAFFALLVALFALRWFYDDLFEPDPLAPAQPR